MSSKNILAIGAYERDNFGDLLFFLVLKHFAAKRKIKVIASSVTYADMSELLGEYVLPYDYLLASRTWDAVWVVGGEVGGADVKNALRMSLGATAAALYDKSNTLAYQDGLSGFFAAPTYGLAYVPILDSYDRNHKTPLVVNSVGAIQALDRLDDKTKSALLQRFRDKSLARISVRDKLSSQFLASHKVDTSLTPDVVHTIASIVPKDSIVKTNDIIFQLSRDMALKSDLTKVAEQLAAFAQANGLGVKLFAAGVAEGHDSPELYDHLRGKLLAYEPSLKVSLVDERQPLELVKIIAGSALWAGSSLHGRIIASAYDTPRLSFEKHKVTSYAATWDPGMPHGVTDENLHSALDAAFAAKSKKSNQVGKELSNLAQRNLEDMLEWVEARTTTKSESERDNYPLLDKVRSGGLRAISEIEVRQSEQLKRYELALEDALQFERQLKEVQGSYAYRIGRFITIPLRIAKRIIRRVLREVRSRKHDFMLTRHIKELYETNKNLSGQKLRVDVVIRSIHHPTSSTFIRIISPLTSANLGGRVRVRLIDGEHPEFNKVSSDVIIVQRTAIAHLDDAKRLVTHAKAHDIKLFVDTDDAFGELDRHHPQYLLQKERVEALDYVMAHADETWFSTDALRDLHDVKQSKVVRNTLDAKIWQRLRDQSIAIPATDEPLRMVYMGTITHDADFALILPSLQRLHNNYKGAFELHVIGVARHLDDYPWMIQHKPDSALYPDFVDWFNRMPQFDIGLSPLEDSNFNRNKSDIKCLDYLACGIRPVVSDVKAYQNPELDDLITRVKNTEYAWYDALEDEIRMKGENRSSMQERAAAGFKYIEKYRSIDVSSKDIAESLGVELSQ